MTTEEIRAAAVRSAKVYYSYLDRARKGKIEYAVQALCEIENTDGQVLYEITLQTGKRLPSTDTFVFEIRGTQFTQREIRIAKTVSSVRGLVVQPMTDDVLRLFRDIEPTEIRLISDLKFLVKRVGEWYMQNGLQIRIPSGAKMLPYTPVGALQKPTAEQQAALDMLFLRPVSYVWGAPGTGKTRYVLAYALLHCIRHAGARDRFLVLAPTNNAVDQTLLGILPVLQAYNESELQVFRFGTPTGELYGKYPQICEYGGASEQVQALQNEIAAIEEELQKRKDRAAERESVVRRNRILSDFLASLDGYCVALEKEKQLQSTKAELAALQSGRQKTKVAYDAALSGLQTCNRKRESVAGRLLAKLSSKRREAYAAEAEAFRKRLVQCDAAIAEADEKIAAVSKTVEALHSSVVSADIPAQKRGLLRYKENADCPPALRPVLSDLRYTQEPEFLRAEVAHAEAEPIPDEEPDAVTDAEYLRQIAEKKEEIQSIVKRHSSWDAAKVFFGTFDALIGKYAALTSESKRRVAHVFVDEAAYAPLVKGMVAFSFDAPVSLFGDHMQLPPVCEMEDEQIAESYPEMVLWAQSAVHCGDVFGKPVESVLAQYMRRLPPAFKPGAVTALNYTHRFGKNLAEVLGTYVYTDAFQGAEDSTVTVEVVHCAATDKKAGSRENSCEATAVSAYLRKNLPSDAVILSPYKAQVDALKKAVPPQYRGAVLTVHASQGQEYDTVLFSVCDTTNMWFTDSKNRMSNGKAVLNTALSRVRKKLVIFCDADFWARQSGQLLSAIIRIGDVQNRGDTDADLQNR